MVNDINVLKELGVQRIHNDTHISKEHIQEILHETFDGLNAVQFTGFISILEREYNINLDELKSKGEAYFSELKPNSIEYDKVFIVPKKQTDYTKLYILLGILVFVVSVYYKYSYLDSNTSDAQIVDNTKIQKAAKNIKPILEIKNSVIAIEPNDTNNSDSTIKNTHILKKVTEDKKITKNKLVEKPVKSVEVIRTLKILPKNKVWVGYIDIKTNQKYQKIFRKEFAIDTTRDWLLLFGAGNIKLEVNGEIKRFASEKNLRFKYVDGEFTKIDVSEFKSLNKGRKW